MLETSHRAIPVLLRWVNQILQIWERCRAKPLFYLPVEEALRLVQEQTGLSDFGSRDIRPALQVWLEQEKGSAGEYPVTRYIRRNHTLQCLRNRLFLHEALKQDPGIRDEKVLRPWFILGLPRTGTTLLQRLLALDPKHRSPVFWECNMYLPAPVTREDVERRIYVARRNLRMVDWVMPELKAIHAMEAETPEECLGIMASGLISGGVLGHSEAIRDWALSQDMTDTYEMHRLHLQMLQRGSPTPTWVLKTPVHLGYLRWLLKVYPDARIIQTHRAPEEVLASAASLIATTQRESRAGVDLAVIGERVLHDLVKMLELGVRDRDASLAGPDHGQKFWDVRYTDLVGNPLDTVARIYQAFGEELSDEARSRMQTYLKENIQHKHGKHRYSLEDFSLDAPRVREAFATYTGRFLRD